MAFNKYFHDELTAIRELGKEFAQRNPRIAPFLAVEAQDPDVERLLEGFAFLTGRLRQKLDDELPELTHSVMNLLWPNFLRPIPSMSILQFKPMPILTEGQRIEKNVEIDSVPVDGTVCRFRTCYDVPIYPLEITHFERQDRPSGTSLNLVLGLTSNTTIDELTIDSLRFFLHGEVHVAQALYLWFSRYVESVRISGIDELDQEVPLAVLGQEAVAPVGFADDESLLPYSEHTFKGYRLIQEYFSLPEKFHFIELINLDVIQKTIAQRDDLEGIKGLKFDFSFSRVLDKHVSPSIDNFRLFCTPIVNLFSHDAKPIRLDHRRTEYRVLPEGSDHQHYETVSIDKVEGWGHEDHQCREYKQFESFDHAHTINEAAQRMYYRQRLKSSVSGYGIDTYLAFVNDNEDAVIPQAESISVSLTCSNRHLPTMLGVGDIGVATGGSPEYAEFHNITYVTPSFTPPLDQGFHWRLISNMSLNYMSLCHLDTFKSILSTYDYRSYYDRQQARASQHRLDGVDAISASSEDRLYQGVPIRGIKTKVKMKESCFSSEGDMYIFASILNEFFCLYASINSFHHMELTGVENGEIYRWQPRLGQQPVI
ncbi:hypothetical protein A9Q99_22915 [Gammaproteobacteria bacterium 45_16_T64]|nr:hypothetical protein A9Q99_22915 [Gammaproteobacteria bacterium 45_16_T64]